MKKIAVFIISVSLIQWNCSPRDNFLKKMAQGGNINKNAALVNTATITINTPVGQIWNLVTEVKKWPTWNPKITAVKANGIIFNGDIFAWEIGKKVYSTVLYFEEDKKIVWFSTSMAYRSIIEWKFEVISKNETRVTLSESRDGFFMNFISSKKHQTLLAEWLENLKNRAEVVIM